MMPERATAPSYRASRLFVALFYALLAVWTAVSLPLIYDKFAIIGFRSQWIYAAMIGFVFAYTWFWSLGLFYQIGLEQNGQVVFKSLRRRLQVSVKQIAVIEGSRFPRHFGFVKLKLPKESVYLFCHGMTDELSEILGEIRKGNPLLRSLRI